MKYKATTTQHAAGSPFPVSLLVQPAVQLFHISSTQPVLGPPRYFCQLFLLVLYSCLLGASGSAGGVKLIIIYNNMIK